MKKAIIIILAVIALSGCKAKQITTEKVITKIDTVRVEIVKEIQVPINNEIIIEQPCDSLGILKDFKQVIKTKTVFVQVEGKNGRLIASVNLDSIKQSTIKEYISKNNTEKEVITVTKFRIPKWVWYSLGLNGLLFIIVFRKSIPFLKFLPF